MTVNDARDDPTKEEDQVKDGERPVNGKLAVELTREVTEGVNPHRSSAHSNGSRIRVRIVVTVHGHQIPDRLDRSVDAVGSNASLSFSGGHHTESDGRIEKLVAMVSSLEICGQNHLVDFSLVALLLTDEIRGAAQEASVFVGKSSAFDLFRSSDHDVRRRHAIVAFLNRKGD